MKRLSTTRQVTGLAGWLLLSFVAAGCGAVAAVSADTFYQQLLRPKWALHGFLLQCGASFICLWESLPGLYGDIADSVNPVWRFGYLWLNLQPTVFGAGCSFPGTRER